MADLLACNICGQVHAADELKPGTAAHCSRCRSMMARHTPYALHQTAALSLAALILYVPANVFPILHLQMHGVSSENTVWEGCKLLFQDGQWGVAIIVFLASIFIPLLKLAGLFALVMCAMLHIDAARRVRTWIYKIIERVGRWAMLDVFVLAVLVSLVKLQRLATILPGKGLVAFCAVVVLTLLASASFDPHVIWNDKEREA
jgi:paraquat-inducible protein A